MGEQGTVSPALITRAFGAANRTRLLDEYLGRQAAFDSSEAWKHVYRLLAWVDQSTGLAHCYESDKCQPGKAWYERNLAFHAWLADELTVSPAHLGGELDWLFRRATSDLAAEVVRSAAHLEARAERQRASYEGRSLPRPGEDPELVAIVKEALGRHLVSEPSPERWQLLVQKIRQYLSLENKRKNLVGEGFEDVLAAVICRSAQAEGLDVKARRLLHDIPGFHRSKQGEKPNKVDLAILRPNAGKRTLVTVKWSVRADREKQFVQEYTEYISAESDRRPFEYVFVTNEFDPARLRRACEAVTGNAYMFAHVVHIQTRALRATYGAAGEESMRAVLGHIDSGRLIDLERWLLLLEAD